MSTTSLPPPPPPAAIYGVSHRTPPQNPSSSSIITVITIIASTIIVSTIIYLLLRYLSRRFRPPFSGEDGGAVVSGRHVAQPSGGLIDSLPLFTFRSVTPPSIAAAAGGDCAVCLSKFEPLDKLRLLPLCCHAFHAACIDAWIVNNQTCPLCRSSVLTSGAHALDQILSPENRGKIASGEGGGGSFRIEIGNVRVPEADAPEGERLYSVGGGAFEYIVSEENALEVSLGQTTHSRRFSDPDSNDKSIPAGEVEEDAEASGGRNLLRECVDRLASVSSSFRSSGRFFTGSSRRSEAAAIVDLEAYRAGEEISEIFRWLSGV